MLYNHHEMCDTRLKPVSDRGEHLEVFLGHYLFKQREHGVNYPNAQRLLEHLPRKGIATEVFLELEKVRDRGEQIDQLIAPFDRTVEDFKHIGGGVVTKSVEGWAEYDEPLLDESTESCPSGLVTVQLNSVQRLTQDPRMPSLWPSSEYDLIQDRRRMGQGTYDRVAQIATCAIALSWFSANPDIPPVAITGTLRHFGLVGANKPRKSVRR